MAGERDVIVYDRGPGTGVVVDETTGLLTFASGQRERYQTELYNEQISVLCNAEGARLLAELEAAEELSIASGSRSVSTHFTG